MKNNVKTRAKFFARLVLSSTLSLSLGLIPLFAIDAQAGTAGTVYELAQQDQQGGGRPPREAMQACEGKSSGASCTFAIPDGTKVTGSCRSPEASVPAACVPAGAAPKG